ncbi:DUF6745 domain-containing protein [Nonomuraea longicatena]|uniref:DUF6745 domain-containing protein n=1 Tax=Nonomuraea longicatena TaxID=83682 RepID=A0ABN1QG16_9ACTN
MSDALPIDVEARLLTCAAAWHEHAFRTGPADRAEARAGVLAAYRAAELAEPARIVWLASPAQAALAAAVLTGAAPLARLRNSPLGGLLDPVLAALGPDLPEPGPSVRDRVRTRPWETARAETSGALSPRALAAAWRLTGEPLWARTDALVRHIRDALTPQTGAAQDTGLGALLRMTTLDAVLGQHDAAWLAAFDGLGHTSDAIEALQRVARAGGWWWPYERVVLMCERPSLLRLDDLGRPHNGDGPALAFPDGFALHAWHGTPMPEHLPETLAHLDAARITAETNAELRRVMLEHYGVERYLADSRAEPVGRDETGILWRVVMPDDEPLVTVEVVNSTPEPDGSRRTYFLRVPPWVRTAREGVAWTFDLAADAYAPQQET